MPDQAENLRQFVQQKAGRARVIAVSSGKGGVGKTNTCVNLGIALARNGARVVLLDADLGLANIEVLLGINSLYNLQHVVTGQQSMMDVVVDAPGGIQIVPGSSGIAQIADLGPNARDNVLTGLEELQRHADFILIDTMAGIGQNAVAFAIAADEVLLVTTPEPSSIVDAYATIKTVFHQRPDAKFHVIVNQVMNKQQAGAVAHKLADVTGRFLERNVSFAGFIPRDPRVMQAVMQTSPYVLRYPNAPASRAVATIAERLNASGESGRAGQGFLKRVAETFGIAKTA
jgi:flagellar biosynthesis protein FlhG